MGYPRTCLRFGHDDPRRLTPELVRDTLKAGRSTISGGLYMTVEGPGGVSPGGTVTAAGSTVDFNVVVQAPKWLAASQLEVLLNGETERTVELTETVTPTGRRYEATVSIKRPSKPHSFVVFHARGPAGRDLSPISPRPQALRGLKPHLLLGATAPSPAASLARRPSPTGAFLRPRST